MDELAGISEEGRRYLLAEKLQRGNLTRLNHREKAGGLAALVLAGTAGYLFPQENSYANSILFAVSAAGAVTALKYTVGKASEIAHARRDLSSLLMTPEYRAAAEERDSIRMRIADSLPYLV